MKYIEYVYLAVAVMVTITLVKEFRVLETTTKIAFLVAILIASFMFSFRRSQRIRFEKHMEEEMRKLEEEESFDHEEEESHKGA